MKSIKEIIGVFKRILPKDINFKKIYLMAIIYALCEVAIIFIVGYYGMNMRLPFAESPHAAVSVFIAIMVLLVGFALFGAIKKRII